MVTGQPRDISKRAMYFVILLGILSLFADMTYEGARSITGPFLALLGATGATVGIVAGLGEWIGYALRLFSGYISDRTGKYWTITIFGYVMNLLAVPLLALAGRWEVAALLIIAERMGKAFRNPPRDVMLSHATKQIGRGWGFGLHEAMDQAGATLGPLLVAAVLYIKADYRVGFGVLLVPALLAMAVLLAARFLYPQTQEFEKSSQKLETVGLQRTFWLYLASVVLIAVGYVDFPLVAYHFSKAAVVPDSLIPVFYSVAMGVDALAALLFGRLFDRVGMSVIAVSALLSALFAPLVFLGGNLSFALAGMIFWGIGMGTQESIMRAAVAEMVPADRRGTAYGIFNSAYGSFWFLGSAAMGILYDISIPSVVAISVVAQLTAIPLIMLAKKRLGPA
ncbi:MAG: MFS transporter [Bacillota bacterium]